tara:strand:+ start:2544 stop:2747 length:204 start_codon:yes stop_codon:yes gene_type:complete
MKRYEVTITPKQITYCGSWTSGQYTVEVCAVDSAKAISQARRDRADEEGRLAPSVSYRARIIRSEEA